VVKAEVMAKAIKDISTILDLLNIGQYRQFMGYILTNGKGAIYLQRDMNEIIATEIIDPATLYWNFQEGCWEQRVKGIHVTSFTKEELIVVKHDS